MASLPSKSSVLEKRSCGSSASPSCCHSIRSASVIPSTTWFTASLIRCQIRTVTQSGLRPHWEAFSPTHPTGDRSFSVSRRIIPTVYSEGGMLSL